MKNMFDDIDDTLAYLITQLLHREPFYGHCITGMVRELVDTLPAPAGIYISNASVHLVINPKKFMEYGPLGMAAILKHEVLHILMNHIARQGEKDHETWNDASDLASNQFIRNIPDDAMNIEKLGFPRNLPAEAYYDMLMKDKDAMGNAYGKDGPKDMDTHDQWADSDPVDIQDQVVKAMAKEASDQSRGKIPAEIESLLPGIFKKHTVPWNVVLRMFAATLGKMNRSATWKKTNRRFQEIPGTRRLPMLNLVVCVDTSASISNEMLKTFFGEIDTMHKDRRNMITIVECDARLGKVYKYSGTPPKKISGRGGTAFRPALEYVNTLHPRVDGIVYLTDGWGDNPEKCTTIPVLWVITPGGEVKRCAQFGRKIQMEQQKERQRA